MAAHGPVNLDSASADSVDYSLDQDLVFGALELNADRHSRRRQRESVFLLLFDRVDAIRIKRQIVLDRAHRRVGHLIGPYGVDRARTAKRNAEIGAVPLVR